jgi:hypothetical protein
MRMGLLLLQLALHDLGEVTPLRNRVDERPRQSAGV